MFNNLGISYFALCIYVFFFKLFRSLKNKKYGTNTCFDFTVI